MLRVALVEDEPGLTAEGVEIEPERLSPDAFGRLYEKHRLSVYRYLRARTRSEADALDLGRRGRSR